MSYDYEDTYVPQYRDYLLTFQTSVNAESGSQKNDLSVKGSSSTQKPPKYRLACDSCQQSKIRCDQKRPKCRRCAKKGIECVYSPARRAGRPRTRNNSKPSQSTDNSAPASSKGDSAPTTESDITTSASFWMAPVAPHSMMSNTSAILSMTPTIQGPGSDNAGFSPSQLLDDSFLHGLPDLTSSHYNTSKEMGNCHFSMSPEFHIGPEPLDTGFCGATWEQQQQRQQLYISTPILLDEGLPYYELLTPDNHEPRHHPDQQLEEPLIPATSSSSIESCSYEISLQQETQLQFIHSLDHGTPSKISCSCTSALLDHLSHASPTSYPASTSAGLSTSRILITSCRNAMRCPNACYMRPSMALIICQAIDRALIALKPDGISMWTSILAPIHNYESGTSSSPQSSSSCSTSGGKSNNDIMLPPADDECEPLRCGTLPIRGADRRVMMRVLLMKRVLEVQGVLERLRDMLLSGLLVSENATMKNQLLALCESLVGECARKVAEKVETIKLQM